MSVDAAGRAVSVPVAVPRVHEGSIGSRHRAEPEAAQRALHSYLLLPRPGDTVKSWILPCAFVVATSWSAHRSPIGLILLQGVYASLA